METTGPMSDLCTMQLVRAVEDSKCCPVFALHTIHRFHSEILHMAACFAKWPKISHITQLAVWAMLERISASILFGISLVFNDKLSHVYFGAQYDTLSQSLSQRLRQQTSIFPQGC